MALDEFKYPSDWTLNYESYLQHREQIIHHIEYLMTNYDNLKPVIQEQRKKLADDFFSGNALYDIIRRSNNG
jgi:hypothetical protein